MLLEYIIHGQIGLNMGEGDRNIYISNAWKGLITETACRQFEDQGWTVDGNWLNNVDVSPLHKVILAAPAYFDGAVIIYPKDYSSSRIFAHLLYPDELVGWDFQAHNYKMEKRTDFIPLLERAPILSHSQHTLELATATYGELLNQERDITHLPIEFNDIQRIKAENSSKSRATTKVLWNHMWRSDKGVFEALSAISQLSSRFPNVEFWIGREESWGNNPDVNVVKNKTSETLLSLRAKDNVFFQPSFNSRRAVDYWRFLSQFDIGFSVSHQEGFGLSMLEQSAAGIACVMPPEEAYPEIHPGGLLTSNVTEGIAELIENPLIRKEISQKGVENAAKFNAEDWTARILKRIT